MTQFFTATTDYGLLDAKERRRSRGVHQNDDTRDPWLAICELCLLPECTRGDGEMKLIESKADTHSLCIIYEAASAGFEAERAIAIHANHRYKVFEDCKMDEQEERDKAAFLRQYPGAGPDEYAYRGIIYHVYEPTTVTRAAVEIPLLCRFVLTNDDPRRRAEAIIKAAHKEEQARLRAWYEAVKDYDNA